MQKTKTAQGMHAKNNVGTVYLVGAGPGDPGLITVKGMECIQTADVLVYDYLANPVLLNAADPDAEIIYVGKKGGDHTLSQEGINDLLVGKAEAGHTVTRLKGGDPYIFGRGGEEAEVLTAHGIPFEVVPGVTSAVAAPAYAGIPLTHRDFTSTLAFVTGHEDPAKDTSKIDWRALAAGIGTLVFFMGVKNLPKIVARLKAHGKPGDTPVALVRWGTTFKQQTITGTLNDIVGKVRRAGIKPPALIVIGKVVTLRKTLSWFENRPLFGKTIAVTRARRQASDLVNRLTAMGAHCLETPTIEIFPPADFGPLDTAIRRLNTYDWLVLTSVNGVRAFFDRLFFLGKDVRSLGHIKVAAIGPVTADRLLDHGLKTDILPDTYRAESVVAAFENENMENRRVLLPRAREARTVLPEALTGMGAVVDEITAYVTRHVTEHQAAVTDLLESGKIDMVTFTSSSTVKNFVKLLPPERIVDLLKKVIVASIGPITTQTAEDLGVKVDITAQTFTIAGLCEAILKYPRPGRNT